MRAKRQRKIRISLALYKALRQAAAELKQVKAGKLTARPVAELLEKL